MRWELLRSFPGIIFVCLGSLYINLRTDSLVGWLLIVVGFVILYLTGAGLPRLTPLEWPILLLLCMATLTLLVTANLGVTFIYVSRLYASVAMFYAVVFWARRQWQVMGTAVALICFGALLSIISPFIVNWLLNKGGLFPDVIYVFLPSPLVTDTVHPNVLASLLLLLMPLAVALTLNNWPGSSKCSGRLFVLTILGSVLMGTALLLTKSRGGYLAASLSLLLLLWWFHWRKTVIVLLFLTAGIGLWLAFATNTTFTQDITDPSTLAFRLNVWRIAFTMIGDFPFTGVGMGTFNQVASHLYPLPPSTNPGTHNLFFQVATDLGLIGLIAFIALGFLILYMGLHSIQVYQGQQNERMFAIATGSLAGFVGLLLHGLVDNTLWGTRMAFMPWMIIGLITSAFLATLSMKVPDCETVIYANK